MTSVVFYIPDLKLGRSEIQQGTGRVSNFNQSINWDHHMKDHFEIGHFTKYDSFRVSRDQVMDLEIWFKIHAKVSNFERQRPPKP